MKGIIVLVVVTVEEAILMMVSILNTKDIMNGTSLEHPILPMSITMGLRVLMGFG